MERNSKRQEIRKGPWKAEEDEVLINHVKKYGPRDWSSIRSKGLLQRTGKSCRLRWVNKLRPDLKSGCKFSVEEGRVVVELQAEFGNKWARIATYLAGRTDNDVKNFWSSRQKKLKRILHKSHAPKSHKSRKVEPDLHGASTSEALVFAASVAEESSSKLQSCSTSSYAERSSQQQMRQMVSFPDLVKPESFGYGPSFAQTEIPFPSIPPPPSFHFLTEGEELLSQYEDPNYLFNNAFDPLQLVDGTQLLQESSQVVTPELSDEDVRPRRHDFRPPKLCVTSEEYFFIV